MGTIALGVFYLASPVAAAGAPAGGIDASTSDAVSPAEIAPAEIPTRRVATRDYIVFDMPAVSRLRVTFLDEQAVAAADRWTSEHAGAAAHPWRLDGVGGSDAEDPGNGANAAQLDDAVIAEHGQRIAFLRERLATLSPGTATPQADDLRRKLRRAEAARKLAVARLSIRAIATGACAPGTGQPCAAGPADRAPRTEPAGAVRTVAALVGQGRPAASAAATKSPGRWPASGRASRFHGGVNAPAAIARVAARLEARPASRARLSAWRLAQARRSLAAARRLLQPSGLDPAPPRRTRGVEFAGLLQWPGSATWTLAAHHSWR